MCLSFYRLKSELERKDLESEERRTRMSSKYQNEISDLQFQVSELEHKNRDLYKEFSSMKDKVNNQVSVEDLQSQLQRVRLQSEHSEREYSVIREDNERLREELSFVSNPLFSLQSRPLLDQVDVILMLQLYMYIICIIAKMVWCTTKAVVKWKKIGYCT